MTRQKKLTPTLLGGLLLAMAGLTGPVLAQAVDTEPIPSPTGTTTYNYDARDASTGIETPTKKLAVGTSVKVKLLKDLSSKDSETGDRVRVQIAPDDTSGLPSGTVLTGRITTVRAGTSKEPGKLTLRFGEGSGGINSPALATAQIIGSEAKSDKSSQYTAIGAGAGAVIGLSRKRKLGDALGGAVLGGLGGYAASALQKRPAADVNFKRGDEITIKLDRPLTLQTRIIQPY